MKKTILVAICAIALIACEEKEPNSGCNIPPTEYVGLVTVGSIDNLFELTDILVSVKENCNKTVDIEMFNVKFAPQMPVTINMVISGVAAVTTKESFSLSGNNITPTYKDQSYPQYTITELEGSKTPETLSLSMICGSLPVTFSGNAVAADSL